jgi:XTP/dITP diphosphohydrolase
MSRLVIATSNPGKVREFAAALADLNLTLLTTDELGLRDFPEETGSSYEENALLKAGFAALHTKLSCLADDSGLEVDALDGAPGVYSARYGGQLSDGERMAYLLDKLRDVPKGARGATFVAVLVLASPKGQIKVFEGSCRGEILEGPRGENGFGYDPLFFSPELGKTFAEASEAEKRRVSHRGKALAQLKAYLLARRQAVRSKAP